MAEHQLYTKLDIDNERIDCASAWGFGNNVIFSQYLTVTFNLAQFVMPVLRETRVIP
jgi:hypothetical protein